MGSISCFARHLPSWFDLFLLCRSLLCARVSIGVSLRQLVQWTRQSQRSFFEVLGCSSLHFSLLAASYVRQEARTNARTPYLLGPSQAQLFSDASEALCKFPKGCAICKK